MVFLQEMEVFRKEKKKVFIIILVVVSVAAIIGFIVHSMREVTRTADEIHKSVGMQYLELLKGQDYEKAYDECLADVLKKDVAKSEFIAQHQNHVAKYGPLESWKQTTYQHEANLFSSESLIGMLYVLSYKERDIFVIYKIDASNKPFQIQEIFGSADTSDSIKPGVW